MNILKIFNNNVILACDDAGRTVVATGRGIGFSARPGDTVDMGCVAQIFVPDNSYKADDIAGVAATIVPEFLATVTTVLRETGILESDSHSPLALTIADHLTHALTRIKQGTQIDYPLRAEVQSLYPHEYAQAVRFIDAMNTRFAGAIPEDEAIAVALHIVNAGFASGTLSHTYEMTGVIRQILSIVESAYSCTLDESSLDVGRFITHLRYLFVRIHTGQQQDEPISPIAQAIIDEHPRAYTCACQAALLIEMRLETHLSDNEKAYLALHIARLGLSQ